MGQTFDHIVVGAGSAGCAVAARLAELTPGTIAVIEAGPTDSDPRVRVPFGLVHMLGGSRDWARRTVAQPHANGREISVPRGRMVGGSGSINSMVWFRGRQSDFDNWGLPGWRWDDVAPAFAAIEARIGPRRLPHPHPLSETFGAVIAANDPGAPPTPERESSGVFHTNMRQGRRWSAADAFLRPAMTTGRVTLLTGVEVDRVVMTGRRATGVKLADGRTLEAMAGVILSAGSIESPMVLMRSGVGPAADLRAAGFEVLVDAPDVGGNLHDHPGYGLHFTGRGYGLTLAQLPAWAVSPFVWAAFRRGRLASNTVEAGGFWTVREGAEAPEVQTHFLPFMLGWRGRAITWGAGFFADVCVCNPRSRGRLRMAPDGRTPLIDPALLSDDWDLETLVLGVTRLRTLMKDAGLGQDAHPGPDVTGEALRDAIRGGCGTAYHPVGTLALGGPVASDCSVRGTEGLWVADASLMPVVTSANTNAPAMMLGWRAGEMIAARGKERKVS